MENTEEYTVYCRLVDVGSGRGGNVRGGGNMSGEMSISPPDAALRDG